MSTAWSKEEGERETEGRRRRERKKRRDRGPSFQRRLSTASTTGGVRDVEGKEEEMVEARDGAAAAAVEGCLRTSLEMWEGRSVASSSLEIRVEWWQRTLRRRWR